MKKTLGNKMDKKIKGFTLLELLVTVIILGVIALIASTILLDALHKSKDSAVKANMSAATSTLITSMSVNERTPEEAISDNLSVLNNPDGAEDSGDEIKSPYDRTLDGYLSGDTGRRGQVALEATTNTDITIRGFGFHGSNEDPIAVKTIRAAEEPDES